LQIEKCKLQNEEGTIRQRAVDAANHVEDIDSVPETDHGRQLSNRPVQYV